jgi:hypothetical protein
VQTWQLVGGIKQEVSDCTESQLSRDKCSIPRIEVWSHASYRTLDDVCDSSSEQHSRPHTQNQMVAFKQGAPAANTEEQRATQSHDFTCTEVPGTHLSGSAASITLLAPLL